MQYPFCFLSKGKGLKYSFELQRYYNEHPAADELQLPIQINERAANIIIDNFKEYTKIYPNVEICFSNPIRIFSELREEIMITIKNICEELSRENIISDNSNVVYPYRKVYIPPEDLTIIPIEYIFNYKKNFISFKIVTFFGYDISYSNRKIKSYFDQKLVNGFDIYSLFSENEELDLKQLSNLIPLGTFQKVMLQQYPLLPTEMIIEFTKKYPETTEMIKELYQIESLSEIKSESFFHKLNRHPYSKISPE